MAGHELQVRALEVGDVDAYLDNMVRVDAESGADGSPHFHPYSASETLDMEVARPREVRRWTTPITEVDWRRAWGLFDSGQVVGHLYLAGAPLPSSLHRVELGVGIVTSHRRLGGGSRLLETAMAWARNEPGIDWIDLGVFADNPGAQRLYQRFGFEVIGRTPDRFRVDGFTVDDIAMTVSVASPR